MLYPKFLNNEQRKVYKAAIDFVRSDSHKMFLISGVAGSGKTTLIKEICKTLTDKRITMTAPTNKAVHVLRDNPIQGIKYQTIHKLLKMRRIITLEGEEVYSPGAEVNLSHLDVLIVDEVSMLGARLFAYLKDYRDQIKIILLGDPCQIPPVRESNSPAFKSEYDFYFEKFSLKKIMRQGTDSPIIELSTKIRQQLNEDTPLSVDDRDKVTFYNTTDPLEKDKMMVHLREAFTSENFSINPSYAKVLAWTNKAVDSINLQIRDIIYGKDLPQLVLGEKLILNRPYVDGLIFLFTGQPLIVREISKFYKACVNHPVVLATLKVRVAVSPTTEYEIDVIDNVDLELFENARKSLWRDANKEHDPTKKRKKWAKYFGFIEEFADVSYGYAQTIHTSQGSEYNKVFIIEHDIDTNRNVYERNRLKYTAFTRAKEDLILVNKINTTLF